MSRIQMSFLGSFVNIVSGMALFGYRNQVADAAIVSDEAIKTFKELDQFERPTADIASATAEALAVKLLVFAQLGSGVSRTMYGGILTSSLSTATATILLRSCSSRNFERLIPFVQVKATELHRKPCDRADPIQSKTVL